MARDIDDSWDIDESVGATALGTAAVRAFESVADSPLFSDPFAQFFLDAVRDSPTQYGGIHPEQVTDPQTAEFVATMTNFAAARTKFIDDFFAAAAESGIRQFVILAAGLDTRAWRLPALSGCTVYELDQPGVLRFKGATLRDRGARPVAAQVSVPIDLRQDWPKALLQSGFKADEATTWSIEGLLPYLPPDAQNALFERVDTLSAPGSRIAVDSYRPDFYDADALHTTFDQMDKAVRSDVPHSGGERIYSEELFFTGERRDVVNWLTTHRWETTSVPSTDAMARYGRPPAISVDARSLSSDFVEARRPTTPPH